MEFPDWVQVKEKHYNQGVAAVVFEMRPLKKIEHMSFFVSRENQRNVEGGGIILGQKRCV